MERRPTILLVDDDPRVTTLLSRLLESDGYEPVEAADAESAMRTVVQNRLDLVLLDVRMPGVDGIDLLRRIRAASRVPVIMLTSAGEEADRVLGLRSGADDYVVKPFSPAELTARIDSVLRRAQPVEGATIEFDALEVHPATRDVIVRGVPVDLTPKEFDLLAFLVAAPRQVFSRAQLLDQVWASSAEWQDPATVTEHIRRLRQKVEADPERPELLMTVRGVGYRYEPPTDAHPAERQGPPRAKAWSDRSR